MRLKLVLADLPHCPRNRSHTIMTKGKFPMMVKTAAARAYEKAIILDLEVFKEEIRKFLADFDKNTHKLIAQWTLRSPDVLTQSGKVSETGTDLDAHKVLQDTIMEVVGIDDGYIMDDYRRKRHSDRFYVELVLRIKPTNFEPAFLAD